MNNDALVGDLNANYRHSAKARGLSWDIERHEFACLIKSPCFYCGANPSSKKTKWSPRQHSQISLAWNGIDRIDNQKGYDRDNCVSCCKRCNRMKMDQSLEEFFERVSRIYNIHIQPNRGEL